MTTYALEASGLTKSYGAHRAVESFDIEVPFGTVLGFLGPNGAGKTTVIRMLSTIVDHDAGTFAVAGVPDSRPQEIRRLIGVLPESAGYPGHQTGVEWLTFHARLFGQSRAQARATAIRLLAEVGLDERAGSLISSYSRGMRQRLGVARALVNDPELVLLDEPTLGLDPAGQRQLLTLVSRIARDRGATVILSTHQLDEVEQTCDLVLILHRGRIVEQGSVAQVVSRAAAPRRARVRVPLAQQRAAVQVLAGADVTADPLDPSGDEWLVLTLPADAGPEAGTATALRVLLQARVSVLGYHLEGGRLSDAFLSLTEAPA